MVTVMVVTAVGAGEDARDGAGGGCVALVLNACAGVSPSAMVEP